MLYSVYSKWVFDENAITDYDEAMVWNNWVLIGNGLSPSQVVDILINCHSSPYEDDYIEVVLPDLEIGDIVLNMKDNRIGKVVYFDQKPLEAFENFLIDGNIQLDKIFEYVSVDYQGETLNWKMSDLIVMNSSTS